MNIRPWKITTCSLLISLALGLVNLFPINFCTPITMSLTITIVVSQLILYFFYYKKAFDVVNHQLLLSMLHSIGIRGALLEWLHDYLSRRTMKVTVQGSTSCSVHVGSGLPQGSVIGPLLFLVYINHVVSNLSCKYCFFADDIKLYLAAPISKADFELGRYLMQRDVNKLHEISLSWGLSFSVEKCVTVRFCRRFHNATDSFAYFIGNQQIPVKQMHKDLGVWVDHELRFHLHVRETATKASGVGFGILKGTVCRSPEFMRAVFITHIRPILDYSSVVWNTGYLGDLRLLEGVQQKWTKMISGFRDLSYSEQLSKLKLYSIKGLVLRANLIMVYKILHSLCPDLDHLFVRNINVRTRGHSYKLAIPCWDTEVKARFFSIRVLPVWNELPEHVVTAVSVIAFKRQLNLSLGNVLYEFV